MLEIAFVNLALDTRHVVRQLRMAPGFTVVSILSLALGIGATATLFSVIYGALIVGCLRGGASIHK